MSRHCQQVLVLSQLPGVQLLCQCRLQQSRPTLLRWTFAHSGARAA